jgi:hypothetical protein
VAVNYNRVAKDGQLGRSDTLWTLKSQKQELEEKADDHDQGGADGASAGPWHRAIDAYPGSACDPA